MASNLHLLKTILPNTNNIITRFGFRLPFGTRNTNKKIRRYKSARKVIFPASIVSVLQGLIFLVMVKNSAILCGRASMIFFFPSSYALASVFVVGFSSVAFI